MEKIFQTITKRITNTSFFSITLVFLSFILPVLFVPQKFVSTEHTKYFLVYLFVFFSITAISFVAFKKTDITVGWNFINISAGIFLVTQLIVAIFSVVPHITIWGHYFDSLSYVSILVFTLLSLLIGWNIKQHTTVFMIQTSVLIGFFLWFVVHVLYRFLGKWLPDLMTLISYKEIAIFAGLVALMSIPFVLLKKGSPTFRIFLYAVIGSALSTLIAINEIAVWIPVMVVSLLAFVFILTYGRKHIGKLFTYPTVPLIIFIIGFVSILFSPFISTYVQQPLGINYYNVYPNISTTTDIAKNVLENNPVVGVGANRFDQAWSMYKPSDVSDTPFWNTRFSTAAGYIPTLFTTTGIVGILGLLALLGSMIVLVFKLILIIPKMNAGQFVSSIVNIIGLLFLGVMILISTGGATTLFLIALFTGLVIYEGYSHGILKTHSISILKYPQYGFVYVILVLIVLLASLYGVYKYSVIYVSEIYANKFSVAQVSSGISSESLAYLDKSASFHITDDYFRLYTQIYLSQINQIIEQSQNNVQIDEAVLSDLVNKTFTNAVSAQNYDPYLLENTLLLAQVYTTFERIGVEGAEGKAMEILEEAKKRFALQPGIPLMQAQIALIKNNSDGALKFVKESLDLKGNFVDAILLQAQIKTSQGNVQESIATLEAGVLQNPQDAILLNQLGLQYFSIKRFDLASTAFYRVVQLSPQEVTARYLLAISLYESGDRDAALIVIKDLQSVYSEDPVVQETYQRILDGTYSSFESEEISTEDDEML